MRDRIEKEIKVSPAVTAQREIISKNKIVNGKEDTYRKKKKNKIKNKIKKSGREKVITCRQSHTDKTTYKQYYEAHCTPCSTPLIRDYDPPFEYQ